MLSCWVSSSFVDLLFFLPSRHLVVMHISFIYLFLLISSMTGGRLNRFNIVKQSKDYDFGGDYVRLWCPELKDVPDKYVHEPWQMSEALMEECGVKIGPGRDYPSPIVNPNVQPRIMNNGGGGRGGRGGRGRGGKQGGRGGRNGQRRDNNPNRGKGQRQDMKSLKVGTYKFD